MMKVQKQGGAILAAVALVAGLASSATSGAAREKLRCAYDAEEMEIGFNSTNIVDLLSHLDADEITFRLSNPVRAAVVSPAAPRTGEDILMLVMPVRLNA